MDRKKVYINESKKKDLIYIILDSASIALMFAFVGSIFLLGLLVGFFGYNNLHYDLTMEILGYTFVSFILMFVVEFLLMLFIELTDSLAKHLVRRHLER